MDRKQFLQQLWRGSFQFLWGMAAIMGLAFILVTLGSYDAAYFLTDLFSLTATAFYAGMIVLFFVVLYCIRQQFNATTKRLLLKMSEPAKVNLRITKRIFNCISLLVTGAVIYFFWQKDVTVAVTMALIMLIGEARAISKEEKQKSGL